MKKSRIFCSIIYLMAILTLSLNSNPANAAYHGNHGAHANHAGHASHHDHRRYVHSAPISVMGDHTHEKGAWMLSYRVMEMNMNGSKKGRRNQTVTDVHNSGFMIAPIKMSMESHMFGAMYGLTDSSTISVMLPYKFLEMSMVRKKTKMMAKKEFSTKSQGFGDIKLSAIHNFHKTQNSSSNFNFGISLPMGDIDRRDYNANGVYAKLPYPMQLGSGTYDFIPGITHMIHGGSWTFGFQMDGVIRAGHNSNKYRLGDEFSARYWVGRQFTDISYASLKLAWKDWDNIDGADGDLDIVMSPTSRNDLRGGRRLDLSLGFNFAPNFFENGSFAIEGGAPIYQKLDGPQLETDFILTAGIKYEL